MMIYNIKRYEQEPNFVRFYLEIGIESGGEYLRLQDNHIEVFDKDQLESLAEFGQEHAVEHITNNIINQWSR